MFGKLMILAAGMSSRMKQPSAEKLNTTQINQAAKQQQSKQFKNQLNKLFAELLLNVDAIQKLFKNDEKILKEHLVMKHFEILNDEEYKVNQKTMKDWKYNEECALENYDQTLEKSSDIYTSLGSPRIIVKYFF